MNIRDNYLNNGYIVLRNAIPYDLKSLLRKELINYANKKIEVLEINVIKKIILQEDIIKTLKEALNTNIITYFSDSSVVNHKDMFSASNGFHEDARNDNHDFSQEYPILRMGIYLQDIDHYSGGLKLKPKSHKYFCFTLRSFKTKLKSLIREIFIKKNKNFKINYRFRSIQPKLKFGDIVLWNMRTHHSGTSVRYKFNENISLPPLVDNILPNFLKIQPEYKENRMAIFIAFGNDKINSENFSKYLKRRRDQKKSYLNKEKFISDLKTFGIRFIES